MEAILESSNKTGGTAGVHVGHGASVSYMLLQQEIGHSVAKGAVDSFGIVGEVDNSVLNTLKVSGLCVLLIKHTVLPFGSGLAAQGTRTFVCFKLAAVVGVLDEKFHVLEDMDVDDDGGVVFDIKQQIFHILFFISEFFDPLLQGFLGTSMLLQRSPMHVQDCIFLQFGQSRQLRLRK